MKAKKRTQYLTVEWFSEGENYLFITVNPPQVN